MASGVEIGPLIVGRYKMGLSPKEIAFDYPHLTLAQVHAALAYYHSNLEEIESDMAQDEKAAGHWERQMANLSQR